jgi:hypothetical protein
MSMSSAKRQLCEEEKRKLIADGHAWTVGQITWKAIVNSVSTDPFPIKYPTCGIILGFDFDIFSKLKKELKSKFQFQGHVHSRP